MFYKVIKWVFSGIVIAILSIGVALGWLVSVILTPVVFLFRDKDPSKKSSTSKRSKSKKDEISQFHN